MSIPSRADNGSVAKVDVFFFLSGWSVTSVLSFLSFFSFFSTLSFLSFFSLASLSFLSVAEEEAGTTGARDADEEAAVMALAAGAADEEAAVMALAAGAAGEEAAVMALAAGAAGFEGFDFSNFDCLLTNGSKFASDLTTVFRNFMVIAPGLPAIGAILHTFL